MTTRAMDLAGCGFDLPDCVRSHFETASHDLRQPLHALALFASQLQGSAPGGECHHLAVKIEAAVTALTERFDRLFDMFQSGCGASHGDEEQEANDGREEPRADVPLEPTVGKLVMVIDDEPLVLDSTCSLLRSWGCEVIGGHSAEANSGRPCANGTNARPHHLRLLPVGRRHRNYRDCKNPQRFSGQYSCRAGQWRLPERGNAASARQRR